MILLHRKKYAILQSYGEVAHFKDSVYGNIWSIRGTDGEVGIISYQSVLKMYNKVGQMMMRRVLEIEREKKRAQ